MVYSVISLICIAIMLAFVAYLVARFCKCNRAEKIEFIKNFKKGKFAVIYIVSLPLFVMANIFAGKDVAVSIFDAISKSVQLVVLKYDSSFGLVNENIYFAIAMYMCFALVIVNAAMITVSVLHQSLWKSYRLNRFSHAKTNKCIVIGNNSNGLSVYGSCRCPALLVDIMSKEEQAKLYIKGVTYQSFLRDDRLLEWLQKELTKQIKRLDGADGKVNVVVKCDNEQDNLNWCAKLLQFINSAGDNVADNVEIFVFGSCEFESIYCKYEEQSKGCLHYVNEYRQIAIDFIDRFPLTEYMNETHIDYGESLLKSGTEINVSMIGFGRTNQQIFLSMVANNQFLTKGNGDNVVNKSVKYYLYDKSHDENSPNCSRFNYKREFFNADKLAVNAADYLPLPSLPACEYYRHLDVNEPDFYKQLEGSLNRDKQAINYVIVSLGMDYVSIDAANKIVARLKERDVSNTRVFVRIRDDAILKCSDIFLDSDICIPFGSNKDVVYNYSHIICEKFSEMAIMRNFIYDIEKDMRRGSVSEQDKKKSRRKWYIKFSITERESNVYACLALREKLHLMGLDYRPMQNGAFDALSEKDFYDIYAVNDEPNFVRNPEGQPVAVKYTLDFKQSRRKLLAEQEHDRWCAFMITKGLVPATRKQIKSEVNKDGKYTNGKNYEMCRHGNLTTFDGLIAFRQMLAERDNVAEEACDVIKYDYQLLDGAWWLLHSNGYEIIKRRG